MLRQNIKPKTAFLVVLIAVLGCNKPVDKQESHESTEHLEADSLRYANNAEEYDMKQYVIQAGQLEMKLKPWYGSAALKAVNDIYSRLKTKRITE